MFGVSKSRNLAPLAGAALVALAPLGAAAKFSAEAVLPTGSGSAARSLTTESRYTPSDIESLHKFVALVASCDLVWPSHGYRVAVLKEFAQNGTLNELPLSPIEQAALVQVARHGYVAVQHSLIAARKVAERVGGVSHADLFSLLRDAEILDRAPVGVTLDKHPPDKERGRGVSLLLLIVAHRELIDSTRWDRERAYLQSVDVAKRTELKLLSGALLLRRNFKSLNPDHPVVDGFVKSLAPKVTEIDRQQISFLETLPPRSSRFKVVSLVALTCGALYLLWSVRGRNEGAMLRK